MSLPSFQLASPFCVAIQSVPSRATRQMSDIVARELLAGWRLPGNGANTIEAKQAKFRTQPQIPSGVCAIELM